MKTQKPAGNRPRQPAPPDRGQAPRMLPSCLLIVALAWAAMHPVLFNGFVHWDDDLNVFRNPFLNPPTLGGLARIWTAPYRHLYIPLVYTSYAADISLAGVNAQFIHAMNLVYHSAAACLVLVLLRQVGLVGAGALAGAALFAVHPLQVEAVAWATGRKDVLSGMFSLLAVVLYLRSSGGGGGGRRGAVAYAAATAAFLLALLAKPAAVSLPAGVLAIECLGLGRNWRGPLARMAPWLAMAVVWTVITSLSQPVPAKLELASPLWARPLIAGDALFFYVRKLLAPWPLVAIHGRTPQAVMSGWWLWAGPLLALATGAAAWAAGGFVRAGAAFCAAALLPVLGLKPFLYQGLSTVADRYFYVAMAGAAIVCAAGLHRATARRPTRTQAILSAAWAAIGLLAVTSVLQARTWTNDESLWTHTMRVNPDCATVHNGLGHIAAQRGDREAALHHYERAITLDPEMPEPHGNMATLHLEAGRKDLAAKAYESAVQADPGFAPGYSNLGYLKAEQGKWDEAIALYRQAIEAQPELPDPHLNIAYAYLHSGRTEAAMDSFETAFRLGHGQSISHADAAALYLRAGRRNDARRHVDEALRLDPGNGEALALLDKLRAGPLEP